MKGEFIMPLILIGVGGLAGIELIESTVQLASYFLR
jgi:hypothetical protein